MLKDQITITLYLRHLKTVCFIFRISSTLPKYSSVFKSSKTMAQKSEYLYHPATKEKDQASACCRLSQLKFSLYLFNILFFISGAILVAIGVWTFLEKHPSLILLTSGLYDVTSCILIFAGECN